MLEDYIPTKTDGQQSSRPGEQLSTGTHINLGNKLVLCDDVIIESNDADHVVMANLATSSRLQVSAKLYDFLCEFREPRLITDVVSRDLWPQIQPQIDVLVAKHILEDANAANFRPQIKPRASVAYRFSNTPAFDQKMQPDFVIIGFPCDCATDFDSRLAAEEIRRKSLDFPFRCAVTDNRPCGWFDADAERWILKGATIADAGDIHIEHGEKRESLFGRVETVMDECIRGSSVPVILGGDYIASQAALAAIRRKTKVTCVRITQSGQLVVQNPDEDALPCFKSIKNTPVLSQSAADIYLSIDLGIASVAYSSPASPEAAALASLDNIKAMIANVASGNRIIGIDLVGLDMRGSSAKLGAALGCQLALSAMDAAYARS